LCNRQFHLHSSSPNFQLLEFQIISNASTLERLLKAEIRICFSEVVWQNVFTENVELYDFWIFFRNFCVVIWNGFLIGSYSYIDRFWDLRGISVMYVNADNIFYVACYDIYVLVGKYIWTVWTDWDCSCCAICNCLHDCYLVYYEEGYSWEK
jgi:hypothetical protein